MTAFKSYQHAVRAGCGLPSSPPDEPEAPELWQVDEDSYLSECCLLSVSKAKNGSFICECGKFCRVDEDATIGQFGATQ